ncbi:MAG: hypothetical protein LBS55_03160 [Prevotellaceae bacterium]|jgi:hypothetical protein|nr:hypothetical protein [Prevotellaceae bacterium]
MERGSIAITENGVIISPVNGEIWQSAWEIAALFGVYPAKVTANIRSILKSGVLREEEVCSCYHYSNGNSVDLYNLEMITALSFRIHSPKADRFRTWLMKQATTRQTKAMATVIVLGTINRINN